MASRNSKDNAAASAISDMERTLTALRSRIDSDESTAGPVLIVSTTPEPTASERQSPTVPPATNPDPQLQIEEYDALGAQIEMSAQHNRIHEADIQFRNFLRQRPHPIKPSSGGHDEASFLHPTSSRPADTEAAIREALARQGDSGNSAAASNRTGYNPQAQEWNPDDRDKDSEGQQGGGADSDQGKSFVPEAEALHPSGEQAGQAGGENER